MKKRFAAATLLASLLASNAWAGGYNLPAMETAPQVQEDEVGSLGGWGTAAAVLGGVAIIALLSSGSSDSDSSTN